MAEETDNEIVEEQKIVKQYLPVEKSLLTMLENLNQNDLSRMSTYLMALYDEYHGIALVKFGGTESPDFKAVVKEWDALDGKYGALDDRMLVDAAEWRERKRALIVVRERIGMGTSRPDKPPDLGRPKAMSAYHECPDNCPRLVFIRNDHRRFE